MSSEGRSTAEAVEAREPLDPVILGSRPRPPRVHWWAVITAAVVGAAFGLLLATQC